MTPSQSQLPVVQPTLIKNSARGRWVHGLRLLILVAIAVIIRFANQSSEKVEFDLSTDPMAMAMVESAFAADQPLTVQRSGEMGEWTIFAGDQKRGYVVRTSPLADDITGFAGPTDCLIGLDLDHRIRSIGILHSRDTVEHVNLIEKSPEFFAAFKGQGVGSEKSWADIDAVSGATLTSYAIVASVAKRITGRQPALKFAVEPNIEKVRMLFPAAATLKPSDIASVWEVQDDAGNRIGTVLTTTPAADNLLGYQGPTATLIGFQFDEKGEEKSFGLAVDQTYDNQPYASYANDDFSFQKKYDGKTLEQLSVMDPQSLGIEGISGATMTSMAIAEGIPLATSAVLRRIGVEDSESGELIKRKATAGRALWSYASDAVTILLTLVGVLFSFTKLSRFFLVRLGYQMAVVLLLGFYSGHMISQASFAGWAANSVPWTLAPGLVILSIAALAVPMVSKHQPYCQHICPFGALQQWARTPMVKKVIPWTVKIPTPVARLLRCVPVVLLAVVIVTAVSGSSFGLASIEPFDGFDFRIAGWATIGVFVIGLLFSFVSPMAYCRFGCPTGAMLNYIRFRADSHRLGLRDFVAVSLVGLAVFILCL